MHCLSDYESGEGLSVRGTHPEGNKITGVVLADHLRCLSWPERNARLIGVVPPNVLVEVREKIAPLLGIE